jgi:hypothetical protein
LAPHLYERGKLNLDEAFVDATFASANKGASPSVPRAAAWQEEAALPDARSAHTASSRMQDDRVPLNQITQLLG